MILCVLQHRQAFWYKQETSICLHLTHNVTRYSICNKRHFKALFFVVGLRILVMLNNMKTIFSHFLLRNRGEGSFFCLTDEFDLSFNASGANCQEHVAV